MACLEEVDAAMAERSWEVNGLGEVGLVGGDRSYFSWWDDA